MKRITLIMSLVFVAMACKKKGCTDPNAINYSSESQKDDGSCVIPDPDPRDEFIGSYWITQDETFNGGSSMTSNYALVISKDPTSTIKVILNNMFNNGNDYSATLSGSNFSFTETSFPGGTGSGSFGTESISYSGSSDGITYSGSGTK